MLVCFGGVNFVLLWFWFVFLLAWFYFTFVVGFFFSEIEITWCWVCSKVGSNKAYSVWREIDQNIKCNYESYIFYKNVNIKVTFSIKM